MNIHFKIFMCASGLAASGLAAAECPAHFNTELRLLHSSKTVNLCDYYQENRPLLIVNTASHCGFTKQFSGLEELHQKYKDQGLVVLGFPSNSFHQEEKSEEGTANVCYKNYGVTFTMFEHVDVKGKSVHPLFAYLAQQSESPSWNFNKYLISGNHVEHFGSRTTPLNSDLEKAVIKALATTATQHASHQQPE